jgi:DtxR family Mn-dependent transcriptional regulator
MERFYERRPAGRFRRVEKYLLDVSKSPAVVDEKRQSSGETGRGRREPSTEAIEDYAKAIYAISLERDGLVLNGEVAQRLGVTPATATSMLKRLAGLGLVDYLPYKGVTLTPTGERVALEVIRHHRLIEAYLSEALGMPSDRVHEEAEVLEHYISEELEELMAAKLGEPSHDPHGTPIPGPDLLPPSAGGAR